MSRVMLLDRVIGDSFPTLTSAADVTAFEEVPYLERIAAASTFDAIKLGAAHNADASAIQFLPNASPEDTPTVISYGQLVARVTQAANMFHALGVGASDVVSFLLPLLPQSFFTLFGAEAAGIANPVNPLLEAHQIAEILEAAGTKVLVALGPTEGSDIWIKVAKVRGQLKQLKAIVQVNGPGDAANSIYSFDALISKQPADRVVSGRQIAARRCRRLLPHRRHHRHAETCSPDSRKPSISSLGMQSDAQVLTGPQPSVRHAAIPCGWRSNANPGNVFEWMLSGGAVAGWLAKSGRTEKCLVAG